MLKKKKLILLLDTLLNFQLFSDFRMPWQGQTDNMIDRFDVRAHLDYIPEYKSAPPLP